MARSTWNWDLHFITCVCWGAFTLMLVGLGAFATHPGLLLAGASFFVGSAYGFTTLWKNNEGKK